MKNLTEIVPGEPLRRGSEYSHFGPIEGYIPLLVFITNRKSHMSFRSVPKLVTLNDLERHNGRYFALFRRIRVAFGAHCVNVVEDMPKLSATEINTPKFLVLAIYHLR